VPPCRAVSQLRRSRIVLVGTRSLRPRSLLYFPTLLFLLLLFLLLLLLLLLLRAQHLGLVTLGAPGAPLWRATM